MLLEVVVDAVVGFGSSEVSDSKKVSLWFVLQEMRVRGGIILCSLQMRFDIQLELLALAPAPDVSLQDWVCGSGVDLQ